MASGSKAELLKAQIGNGRNCHASARFVFLVSAAHVCGLVRHSGLPLTTSKLLNVLISPFPSAAVDLFDKRDIMRSFRNIRA
jgi:hypothetical protein